MLGMWIIPFLLSVKFAHVRFILIWIIFTCITIYVAFKATRTPINQSTPRLVYKWFIFVHKVSYVLGIVGYVGLMLTFLGFNALLLVSPTVIM
jgi:RING finger protein 121/175